MDEGRPLPVSPGAAPDQASRAAGALVLGNVLATASEIVVPLVIVRIVGKADVASLMALLLIYNTVALVVLAGFPQSVQFFLPTRPLTERAAIVRTVVRTLLALGAVAGALLVLIGAFGGAVLATFAGADKGSATGLAPLMLLAGFPLGDLPARILPNVLVVEGRARTAAAYGVFRSLGVSLCSVVPLALGGDVFVVAASLSLFAGAQWLFLGWQRRRLYARSATALSPVGTRELFRFGLPLGATDIVSKVNSQFDRLLILLFFPSDGFADYQAGAWQIPIVTALPMLVGTAIAPRMVALFEQGKPREALGLWRDSIGKVSLLVVPVTLVVIVGAEEVVEVLFTRAYSNAAGVLRWYALLSVARVAAFGTVIVAAGRPGLILRAALFSFAANAALSIPLLYWMGFEGPAAGTALAFIPMATFYCWCIAQATGLRLREVFPLLRYLRVLAVGLVGAALAWWFAHSLEASAALSLLGQVVVMLTAFSIVGTLTGTITRADWRAVAGRLFPRSRTKRTDGPM